MSNVLLVCSGGGHLKQLNAIAHRLGVPPEEQSWVTFDNALSRSLLSDRDVTFVPFAAPRDAVNIARIWRAAHRILKERDVRAAVSTGSSPAVAFLPLTARRGIPSHYIESAARADGPSLSGRIVARRQAIHTYTQYPVWADDRWLFRGAVFDAYEPGPTQAGDSAPRRAVVTVGTQRGYGFDRLFEALVPLLRDVDDVLWQTGEQDVSRFGIEGRPNVPHAELAAAISEADVVVAHAGVGSALTAIELGKAPILVPRLARHREHVDDHQIQIARELDRRGIAFMRHPESLRFEDLTIAATASVETVTPPPFVLNGIGVGLGV